MHGQLVDILIFLLVVGARFLIPLLIPRFPLPAIIAALVIDAADQSIFQKYTSLDLNGYQSYDKALDIYYLTIAYLSVIRNWTNGFAVEVARFLWYYRLIGVVLFELLDSRAILFILPNTFEYFFIAYEVIRTGWNPLRLSRSTVLWIAGLIWVLIKLPQEWWIHIAQNDFTDFMKETVLGVDADAAWSTAFGNRPVVTAVLSGAAIAAVVGGRILWSRLPERDWSIRFNVDKPIQTGSGEVPTGGTRVDGMAHDGPDLRWPICEKITLISLVGMVFGQMLGISISNWQVIPAAALVVAVNAGISQLFVRNGAEWGALFPSFVSLAIINAGLLMLYASWAGEGRVNRSLALFFGTLLTLITVMYDRFRGMRRRATGVSVQLA
ncbi:MAG: hypothetical protein WBF71_16875 [Microthrixaceae bacterium]